MLTKYCLCNSQAKIKFCCFNFKFKRTLYPFILFAVCCLINFGIPLDMLVGLLYGITQFFMEKVTTFPSMFITKLSGLLNLSSVDCWVPYQGRGEYSDQWAYQNLD